MIDLTMKVTALLGAAWVVAYLLRGRAASLRHAVWIGLMAAALLLPLFAALVPRIELAWLPADVSQPQQASVRTFDAPRTSVELSSPAAPSSASLTGPAIEDSRLTVPTLRQALLAAWFAVTLLLVVRLVAAHVQARRVLAACASPSDALAAAVASVSSELGVHAPPVRVANTAIMPAVIGILRPSIVLPSDAATWTAERLRVVLLHECAHVRRRDALLQVISSVAAAAYWWHPLSWLAARRVARERELACDDLVIASGTSGTTYAEHLLDIARSMRQSNQPSLASLAMARPSELEGRLIALLEERPRDTRPARALAIGVALALAAVAIVAPLKVVARDAAIVTVPDEAPTPTPAPVQQAGVVTEPARAPRPQPAADVDVQAVPAPALDQTMADVLWRATGDEDPDIRLLALAKLSRSASPKRVPMLLDALDDPSEDIRAMALLGLIHMEQPEVLPHLTRAMKDDSEDVRTAAVMGLSRLDHPDKTALLLAAAGDQSEDVRTMAALGLGREHGAAVDEMLVKLSNDASPDVRRAAIIAITRRTGGELDIAALLGAGAAEAVASAVAQGVAGGIAGALDARFGSPRRQ